MPDIQKLLEALLHGRADAEDEDIASKVYRDRPILFTAAQMKNVSPVKYREMRKIAQRSDCYFQSDAAVFYQQAKFMEDFEDDYEYHGDFVRYFPTYQSMGELELRGYFTWRARVRRGQVERTSLSFVFVYLYELLNLIGVQSPQEGFQALQNFWGAYRQYDARIDPYLRTWLKDYIVYYDLDRLLLKTVSDERFDEDLLTVLDFKSHSGGELFAALNALSSYNLAESKFYKLHPAEVREAVCAVFSSLWDYYEKNRKNNLVENLFGKYSEQPYIIFKSAVFYHREKRRDFVYEASAICKYRCRDGEWTCERFFGRRGKNKGLGALLKNTDYLMRQKYGFKSTLKAAQTTKAVWDIIRKEVGRQPVPQAEKPPVTVEIDLSKLQDIRRASLETQEKLIVDDAQWAQAPRQAGEAPPAPPQEPPNGSGLSGVQVQFLRCLLYGKPYAGLLKAHRLLRSLLVDEINEALLDRFGDTVIDASGDAPVLVADYIDELKGMVKE